MLPLIGRRPAVEAAHGGRRASTFFETAASSKKCSDLILNICSTKTRLHQMFPSVPPNTTRRHLIFILILLIPINPVFLAVFPGEYDCLSHSAAPQNFSLLNICLFSHRLHQMFRFSFGLFFSLATKHQQAPANWFESFAHTFPNCSLYQINIQEIISF